MNFNFNQCGCIKPTGSGKIELDIPAIISMALEYDCPPEIVDAMATNSAVIEQVTKQITTGWTDLGSHGSLGCTASHDEACGLGKARRDISKMFNDIQVREIKRLEAALAVKAHEIIALHEFYSNRRKDLA